MWPVYILTLNLRNTLTTSHCSTYCIISNQGSQQEANFHMAGNPQLIKPIFFIICFNLSFLKLMSYSTLQNLLLSLHSLPTMVKMHACLCKLTFYFLTLFTTQCTCHLLSLMAKKKQFSLMDVTL